MSKSGDIISRIMDNYDYWREVYITKSLNEFCRELGFPVTNISYVLKKLGWGYEYKHSEIYRRLPNMWEEETDEKYYLLGYMVGDGNMARTSYKYSGNYGVSSKDKEVLEYLKNKGASVSYQKNGIGVATIYNKKEYDWLIGWGMTPNKSYDGMHLGNIPREYEGSFLRGLMDSDGNVSIKNHTQTVLWVGHKSYMDGVYKIISRRVRAKYYKDNKELWRVVVGNREDFLVIRNLMYEKCNLCLERKKSLFYSVEPNFNIIPSKDELELHVHKINSNRISFRSEEDKQFYLGVINSSLLRGDTVIVRDSDEQELKIRLERLGISKAKIYKEHRLYNFGLSKEVLNIDVDRNSILYKIGYIEDLMYLNNSKANGHPYFRLEFNGLKMTDYERSIIRSIFSVKETSRGELRVNGQSAVDQLRELDEEYGIMRFLSKKNVIRYEKAIREYSYMR